MIRKVSYSKLFMDDAFPEIVEQYGRECSALGTPNPDPLLYAMLENSGGFQAFGVYDGDKLIGFGAVLVYVLPHFGRKIAASESVFILKENRKSWLGIDLLEEMKNHARSNGCEKFIYSAPVGSRFDQMLRTLYPHTNNIYIEDLA
jgi:GNAT superfamily N-acetyltransferase